RTSFCLYFVVLIVRMFFFFFLNPCALSHFYTLSLHDALPISGSVCAPRPPPCGPPGPSRPHWSSWRQYLLHKRYSFQKHRCFWKDRKSTRLNSSHVKISYAVFCLKKKKNKY